MLKKNTRPDKTPRSADAPVAEGERTDAEKEVRERAAEFADTFKRTHPKLIRRLSEI